MLTSSIGCAAFVLRRPPGASCSAHLRIDFEGRRASAASRRLDRGDVDLLHRHHRLERALGLSAAGRHRVGQHARSDLPGEAPAVLAPAARALLAAVADDRVPVAVRLRLIVGGDLEGERLAVLERRAAVEAEARNADTVNSTVKTSPALPPGKSPGALWTAFTWLFGKVAA